MSTAAPVISIIFLMFLPPGPMPLPIFEGSILKIVILGAYSDIHFFGL